MLLHSAQSANSSSSSPPKLRTCWEELQQSGFGIPDKKSLARARIALDITAAAMERDRVMRHQNAWYQLNFDSSPKAGQEVFAIRQCIITNGQEAESQTRSLPLCSLGFGHCNIADKTAALIHAIMMIAGPTEAGHQALLPQCLCHLDRFWDRSRGQQRERLCGEILEGRCGRGGPGDECVALSKQAFTAQTHTTYGIGCCELRQRLALGMGSS